MAYEVVRTTEADPIAGLVNAVDQWFAVHGGRAVKITWAYKAKWKGEVVTHTTKAILHWPNFPAQLREDSSFEWSRSFVLSEVTPKEAALDLKTRKVRAAEQAWLDRKWAALNAKARREANARELRLWEPNPDDPLTARAQAHSCRLARLFPASYSCGRSR